jgi:hypothetical protein
VAEQDQRPFAGLGNVHGEIAHLELAMADEVSCDSAHIKYSIP